MSEHSQNQADATPDVDYGRLMGLIDEAAALWVEVLPDGDGFIRYARQAIKRAAVIRAAEAIKRAAE